MSDTSPDPNPLATTGASSVGDPSAPEIITQFGIPAADLALPAQLHRPRAIASALAVAECLYVSEAGPPPPARLKWLGRELDDFLERIGPDARATYLAGLFLLNLLAPLLSGHLTPLRKMPLGQRARTLDRMETSSASGLLLAVKAMLCIIYYEHPDAAASIGFDAECMLASDAALTHPVLTQPALAQPSVAPQLIPAEALRRSHD